MSKQGWMIAILAGCVCFVFAFNALRGDSAAQSGDTPAQLSTEEEAAIAEADREQRSELRAFYTAPPVVPHEVDPRSSRDCPTCHGMVRELGVRTSVRTPHLQLTNCQQCHVAADPVLGASAQDVETTWEGLEEPKSRPLGHIVAPPTIPHRVTFRESCLSCHSEDGPYESLRTPHPDRSNCQQCHVAEENAEFRLSPKD